MICIKLPPVTDRIKMIILICRTRVVVDTNVPQLMSELLNHHKIDILDISLRILCIVFHCSDFDYHIFHSSIRCLSLRNGPNDDGEW